MNKTELSDKLHHLDPGATLPVEASALAEAFQASALSERAVEAIEAFALEHRCTFICPDHAHPVPRFEKDDIY